MTNIFSSIFGNKVNVNNLESNEFQDMITSQEDIIILDVRTIEEYNQARIPNSIIIDFYKSNFINELKKLDRTKCYMVYCRSGSRSYHTAKKMIEMGFERVYNLKSGIIQWSGKIESE
jgi:rhodanese-related sulfurtransferase